MESGSAFIIVLRPRKRANREQDLDGNRLCDAGGLRRPDARYIDAIRRAIKIWLPPSLQTPKGYRIIHIFVRIYTRS